MSVIHHFLYCVMWGVLINYANHCGMGVDFLEMWSRKLVWKIISGVVALNIMIRMVLNWHIVFVWSYWFLMWCAVSSGLIIVYLWSIPLVHVHQTVLHHIFRPLGIHLPDRMTVEWPVVAEWINTHKYGLRVKSVWDSRVVTLVRAKSHVGIAYSSSNVSDESRFYWCEGGFVNGRTVYHVTDLVWLLWPHTSSDVACWVNDVLQSEEALGWMVAEMAFETPFVKITGF